MSDNQIKSWYEAWFFESWVFLLVVLFIVDADHLLECHRMLSWNVKECHGMSWNVRRSQRMSMEFRRMSSLVMEWQDVTNGRMSRMAECHESSQRL